MSQSTDSQSRALLGRLRESLAKEGEGQERLDRITHIIADSMGCEVCSIYLFRDGDTLELCATEGLNPEAVRKTRMKLGEGLVGRVAKTSRIVNTADAPNAPGFRFMAETGEEVFPSFLGIPVQRLGERLGVLVVQSKEARKFTDDEVYALEVVAMVVAEMTELGAFVGEGAALSARHQQPVLFRGAIGQEGAAEGHVYLHEPRVVVTNPIADDPQQELTRLHEAVNQLRVSVDDMLATAGNGAGAEHKEQMQVLETYRMFANSKGWMRRMEEDIARGLSAEAAVEKEQSIALIGVTPPTRRELVIKLRKPGVLEGCITEWQQTFDTIIFDTSPINRINANNIPPERVAAACNGSLLVVLAGSTTEVMVSAAIDKLNAAGAQLLACVYNDRFNPSLKDELLRELRRVEPRFSKMTHRIENWIRKNQLLAMEI